MHNRTIRSSILALLIAVGIGAAYVLWNSHQQSIAAADRSRTLNTALDAVLADLSALGAAQQAYVAPGQSDGPWMTQVSSLLQRLYDQAAAVRAAGPVAASTAQTMRESLDAFVAVDAHAREYLRMHQDLMASDLVFNDARESLASIAAGAKDLRAAAAAVDEEALRQRNVQQASVLGATAGLWLMGVVLLMRSPRAEPSAPPLEESSPIEVAAEPDVPVISPAPASIDWPRAAAMCSDLARLTDGAALPEMFTRIGQALNAPGVILWLGAGEQLFAAAAHGYEKRVLSRLGPIDRAADNATAAAWRTATLQTVAGDAIVNGAIVAPLVGPGGCRGVLAVEVRAGRDSDLVLQSVISMMAAQFGGLVAAWPAASAADETPVSQAM